MKNIAITSIKNIEFAVTELRESLQPSKDDLIIYFASSNYDPVLLAKEINQQFNTTNFGCTSSGELASGKMLDNSIVAMSLSKSSIDDYELCLVEGLDDDLEKKVKKGLISLGVHFESSINNMDHEKYVGLLLMDGLSNKEEKINDLIGNYTNLVFVGGSAGDDLKFDKTYLFYNGKAYSNAAILALLKPKNGFEIIKTQSFKATGEKLKVTKVNEEERRVVELNDRPAANVYADALGCGLDELKDKLFQNPVGIVLDENDPFVRSPRIVDNNDVLFYCGIKEGQELNLLQSTNDIVEKTKEVIDDKVKEKSPSGLLVFNCVLRKLELEQNNQGSEYAKIFENVPTIGFHTYGESYIGHVNQTATMLLLN